MKRAAGMKRAPPAGWSAAVRALAFKWIRIIFRLWKTNTLYREATDQQQLQATRSPLLPFLETGEST